MVEKCVDDVSFSEVDVIYTFLGLYLEVGLCYNTKVMERIKDIITNMWACIWTLGSNVWNLFKGVGQRINSMCVGDKVCSLAVIFILVMSYFYIQDKQVKQAAELAEAQQQGADSLTREERLNVRMNVLVLGVDQLIEGEDNGQRSDTMFVMMFDPEQRKCSLLNVPRDTRVQMEINGQPDYFKINAAYTLGGVKNTMKVVEEFLGIRLDKYLLIDVNGFKRVVDAIGGVDLYVDRDMKYDDFKQGLHIDLKAGQQHLDGEHAMQYVRFRHEYGDISRIRRQQRFLWAVQQKIVSGKMLMRIPGLTKELMNMVRTNLSMMEMLPMARTLYDMVQEHSFRMSVVPGTAEYLYDVSYWTPHVLETRQMVADLNGVPFEGRLAEAAHQLDEIYTESVHRGRIWQGERNAEEKSKELEIVPQVVQEEEKKEPQTLTETKVEPEPKKTDKKKSKQKKHRKKKKDA